MEYKIVGAKRFIAGAVCPQCKAADKTITFPINRFIQSEENGAVEIEDEIMACVSCSFEQSKLELSLSAQKIPASPAEIRPLLVRDATNKEG
ncbi:MAG: YheV family putative metal-binding protein [Pseudomonadales bacterium]|nr:YheV family putative metal-binding protein [Pseudomonadales bacterium]